MLSDGVIIESGKPTELMAAHGAFAKLFALQAAGYQLGATADPIAADLVAVDSAGRIHPSA